MHAAMADGSDGGSITGPRGLAGWICQTRAVVPDLRFTIEVGPIGQDGHIAIRWRAAGTYAGGFPGAAAAPGTPVAFTGTDVLRLQDGTLAEYWVNSDMHVPVRPAAGHWRLMAESPPSVREKGFKDQPERTVVTLRDRAGAYDGLRDPGHPRPLAFAGSLMPASLRICPTAGGATANARPGEPAMDPAAAP